MILTKEMANEIVKRTMAVIGVNINVMNADGVIVGSGDKSRIGQVHEGAKKAIKYRRRIDITEVEMKEYQSARAGINLPIFLNQIVVGVIGITGIPAQVEKYGELVKMAAEVMLQQSYLTEQLQWEERIKEEMISQLIRDEMDDLYEERAKLHGLIIDFPGVVVIMEITKGRFSTFSESEWKQEIVTSLHPFISNGEIISTISPSTFILLKKLNVVKEK